MTNVTGFILMTVAALCLVFAVGTSVGSFAITLAATAFVAGMYFGILLNNNRKKDDNEETEKD